MKHCIFCVIFVLFSYLGVVGSLCIEPSYIKSCSSKVLFDKVSILVPTSELALAVDANEYTNIEYADKESEAEGRATLSGVVTAFEDDSSYTLTKCSDYVLHCESIGVLQYALADLNRSDLCSLLDFDDLYVSSVGQLVYTATTNTSVMKLSFDIRGFDKRVRSYSGYLGVYQDTALNTYAYLVGTIPELTQPFDSYVLASSLCGVGVVK